MLKIYKFKMLNENISKTKISFLIGPVCGAGAMWHGRGRAIFDGNKGETGQCVVLCRMEMKL